LHAQADRARHETTGSRGFDGCNAELQKLKASGEIADPSELQ
jgi:hypothetical protein